MRMTLLGFVLSGVSLVFAPLPCDSGSGGVGRVLAAEADVDSKPGDAVADLILIAGQSNAVGYDAAPKDLPADPADKDVLFWWRCGDPVPDEFDSTSGNKWVTLQPQPRGTPNPDRKQPRQYGNFAHADGGFGPEMGLARTLMKSQPERKLAIVKAAWSGTGMRTDWNPDDAGPGGSCYRGLVAEVKAATAAAKASGITLRPRAIVWVQGESDANPRDSASYEKALGTMLSALRKDLDAPRMMALIGINTRFAGIEKINPQVQAVIDAQKALAEKDSRCVYVDNDGAGIINTAHFSGAGTLEIGRRAADALLKREDGLRKGAASNSE